MPEYVRSNNGRRYAACSRDSRCGFADPSVEVVRSHERKMHPQESEPAIRCVSCGTEKVAPKGFCSPCGRFTDGR